MLAMAGDMHHNPGTRNADISLVASVRFSLAGQIQVLHVIRCEVWYNRYCASLSSSKYEELGCFSYIWMCFKCHTANYSNGSFQFTIRTQIVINIKCVQRKMNLFGIDFFLSRTVQSDYPICHYIYVACIYLFISISVYFSVF